MGAEKRGRSPGFPAWKMLGADVPRRSAGGGRDGNLGKTGEKVGAAMVAKCVLGSAVSIIVVLVVSQVAFGGDYGLGYVWNRQADWTVRPDSDHGTTNGNPDDDSMGNPVWRYEYYDGLPDDSNLDSANPWFTLAPTGPLTWDKSYWGGIGLWSIVDDSGPIRPDKQIHGFHTSYYHEVPFAKWISPAAGDLTVSITSGVDFSVQWSGLGGVGAPSDVDIVIAHVAASDANDVTVLWSQTVSKPSNNGVRETLLLSPLDLPEVLVKPGDQIMFTFRTRASQSSHHWNNLYDDLSITVVPEPAVLTLLCLGAGVVMRRRRRDRGQRGQATF